MPLATTRSRRFVCDYERDDDGYWYTVDGGELRGPFRDDLERELDLVQLIGRWRARAQQLGGSVVRSTDRSWVVTLPLEHDIEGGEDFQGRAWGGVHHRAA